MPLSVPLYVCPVIHLNPHKGEGYQNNEGGCRKQLDLILIGDPIDLGPGIVTGSIHGLMIMWFIFRE